MVLKQINLKITILALFLIIGAETQNIVDYTPWNDRGEGNFWYLDRHVIDCGKGGRNKFINGFAYQRDGDNIRYKFSCAPFSYIGERVSVKINFNLGFHLRCPTSS